MKGIKPAGKTDPAIVREIFVRKLGIEPSEEQINEILEHYLRYLEEEVATSPGYQVLPGVYELLEDLHSDPEILLGLATGNIKDGARIKLSHSDLWRFFRFGGFGSDSEAREEIVRMAVQRGLELASFDPEILLVVGDTPLDISAAHAAGVKALGVATGPYSVDELLDAGADAAMPDLSDISRFHQILNELAKN